MIMVTRRNGSRFALNADLIERVEETPDTVVTLVGGTKFVVAESLNQIVLEFRQHKAAVLRLADAEETATDEDMVAPLQLLPPGR